MSYYGDRALSSTIMFQFTTSVNGTPTTLSGSPVISVYKNSTTESTSGVTLTADYDTRTGLNHVVIDTSSDGTFYATGNDFSCVITTGTVGGISQVGVEVAAFSIGRSSASAPTVAQIATAVWQDTTAGDFTTSLSIGKSILNGVSLGTGLTINAYTGDTPQTGDAYAIVKSGGTGDNAAIKAKTDNLPAVPASTTNITAGTITTVTNLTNAATSGDLTSTMKTSVTTAATAATPTAAAVTGAVGSVTGAVGSVTGLTASNLDATISSRLASASYTAPPSAATIASTVWSSTMDTGYSALQTMRLFMSILLSKISGAATVTNTFRDINDTKDRVTATVDADGNRTAITLDPS